MFRYLRGLFFLLLLGVVVSPIQALPTATWWAVAHNQCDDTLHWISPSGEAASIPRPRLPDEAPIPACSARSMHISQDGRYLAETGRFEIIVWGGGPDMMKRKDHWLVRMKDVLKCPVVTPFIKTDVDIHDVGNQQR